MHAKIRLVICDACATGGLRRGHLHRKMLSPVLGAATIDPPHIFTIDRARRDLSPTLVAFLVHMEKVRKFDQKSVFAPNRLTWSIFHDLS